MPRLGWTSCGLAFVLLLSCSCTSKLPPSNSRWPHNRRLHDERLQKLEALQMEARMLELEKRVLELENKATAPAAPPEPQPSTPPP